MKPAPDDQEVTVGSIVVNSYVQRKVTVFAIHEHEVASISLLNTLSSFCFSAMAACFSFAVATWVNVAFQSTMTPEANIIAYFISPFAAVLGVGLAITGFCLLRSRGSTMSTIKSQSVSAQKPDIFG